MPTLSVIINIILLIIIILIIRYYKNKLKRKKEPEAKVIVNQPEFWCLPVLHHQDIHTAFTPDELGLPLSTEVFFLGKGDINVPGGTNDTETWVLSLLAKNSKLMFEFGTCTGKTTYLWAKNSPPEAKVYSLTLSSSQINDYQKGEQDSEDAYIEAVKESKFTSFLYSGTEVEEKIVQLYTDSKIFDETPFINKCDLIFIDGSHAYSYLKNDTEKALRMIKRDGIILWHDYKSPFGETRDVYKYLNELYSHLPLYLIEGTTLAYYRHQ